MASFLSAGSVTGSLPAGEEPHSLLVGLTLTTVAVGIWALEFRRRVGTQPDHAAGGHILVQPDTSMASFESEGARRCIRKMLPDICGLVLCLVAAGMLLYHGEDNEASMPTEDVEIWQQIRNEWPLLVTADSLLGLKAMLRLLLLTSAAFRTKEALDSALAGWPFTFLLLAALSNAALLMLSPPDIYHLDGPLGGTIYFVLEMSGLVLLIYLALAQVCWAQRGPRCASTLLMMVVLASLWWAASSNRLALADPGSSYLDVLFSAKELLELAAAVAYVARSLSTGWTPVGAFAAFAGVLLPLQELLSAYFLLTAWGGVPLEEIPQLVGAGSPLRMLQLGAVAQVGAYAIGGVTQLILNKETDKRDALYIEI